MDGWILILPNEDYTSYNRANLITRELYNITAPEAQQFAYQADGTVFSVLTHPDGVQTALQIDTEFVIDVSSDVNLDVLISAFHELSAEEIAGLRAYIETASQITFGNIIPSTATVRDYQYMVDNGWIQELE
jgi:hypothetical protein